MNTDLISQVSHIVKILEDFKTLGLDPDRVILGVSHSVSLTEGCRTWVNMDPDGSKELVAAGVLILVKDEFYGGDLHRTYSLSGRDDITFKVVHLRSR